MARSLRQPACIWLSDYGDAEAMARGDVDAFGPLCRALEDANDLAAGTWETGGDDYANYQARSRWAVVIHPGAYSLSRPLPIRYRGVVIVAHEPRGPTEPSEGIKTTLYCDHPGNGIEVDATFNVNGFFLRELSLQKRGAFLHTGRAISMRGPNYVFGFHMKNVAAQWFGDNGLDIVCQDLADGSGSMSDLLLEKCQLANNQGRGINIRGHVAIGGLVDCCIVANSVGGARLGAKGIRIVGCDFEGQDNPLEVNNGSSSSAVVIENNYFEGNPATVTPAVIQLGLVNGFRVEANQFSGDSLVPRVLAESCANGIIDEAAHLRQCINVTTRGGVVLPTAGTGVRDMSQAHNANWPAAPRGGSALLAGLNERGGGNDYFRAGPRVVAASLIQTGAQNEYRQLITGFSGVPAGAYTFFAFGINYSVDLPSGTPTVMMIGNKGDGATVLATWGLTDNIAGSMAVGDTLNVVVGVQNTDAVPWTQVSAYFYPYSNSATPALGARLSQVLQWIQTSPAVPNISPLEMVTGNGTGSPTSGEWGVGDRISLAPAVGGHIGKACVAGGAPGTWASFGCIS